MSVMGEALLFAVYLAVQIGALLAAELGHEMQGAGDGGARRELLATLRADTAAVILEPLLQAAGGIKSHPPEIVAAIAHACREQDVLVIADEIATVSTEEATAMARRLARADALTMWRMTVSVSPWAAR